MIATIGVHNIHIDCIVGIYDHERVAEQPLFVDIEVDNDIEAAATADHIDETVDYDHLTEMLTTLAKERKYQLIETFAQEGLNSILERWSSIQAARIEIRKPKAVPSADASFVRMALSR